VSSSLGLPISVFGERMKIHWRSHFSSIRYESQSPQQYTSWAVILVNDLSMPNFIVLMLNVKELKNKKITKGLLKCQEIIVARNQYASNIVS
jgi:hypothetical protein